MSKLFKLLMACLFLSLPAWGGTLTPATPLAKASVTPIDPIRLARVTAYWPGEPNSDYYTDIGLSSTGTHLQPGHCAVDPKVIPYGSVVQISGMGNYIAVDTGSAVVSREAARRAAQNPAEQNALVVDLYFPNAAEAKKFTSTGKPYAAIRWNPSGLASGPFVAPVPVDPKVVEAHRRFVETNTAMASWVDAPSSFSSISDHP